MRWLQLFLCLAVPVAVILGCDFLGVWVGLGAHPWWSLSGAGIGMGIGLAVFALLALLQRFGRVSLVLLLLVFGVAALIAGTLALNGKESFAMSYARDAVAGRFWYFGYIGFIAALYAVLVTACRALFTRRV